LTYLKPVRYGGPSDRMRKVDELAASDLDYFVAKAEEIFFVRMEDGFIIRVTKDNKIYYKRPDGSAYPFAPSTDWRQGGAIMQSAGISVERTEEGWRAHFKGLHAARGYTMLEAAMRTRVKMKFGELVESE